MTESKWPGPTPLPKASHPYEDEQVERAVTRRTPHAARLWLIEAHTNGLVTDDQWRHFEGRCHPDER